MPTRTAPPRTPRGRPQPSKPSPTVQTAAHDLEPGVLLKAHLERNAPGRTRMLAELERELVALQQELGFEHFIAAVEQHDAHLTLRVFPASTEPPSLERAGQTSARASGSAPSPKASKRPTQRAAKPARRVGAGSSAQKRSGRASRRKAARR